MKIVIIISMTNKLNAFTLVYRFIGFAEALFWMPRKTPSTPLIRNSKSLNLTLAKKSQLKERSNQLKKFVQGDYNLINPCLFNLVTQFGNLL